MLIGKSYGKDVLYWHNMIWVRGGYQVIRHAGTQEEAIERAKRVIRGFIEA